MTVAGRRVTTYAKSTVVSTTPVRPGKTYPLSVLDHAMERHSLHMVFYYRAGPTLSRDLLKESMSELLLYFPATTGRMSREEGGKKWVVKCNDAGVRVLDARAEATVEEWLATATAAEERELIHWEPMGNDSSIWSTFYVKITEFKDRGYSIGLSCTHMHADPTCAALLVKAWSDCHRRACIAYPPFFHPPALIPRPNPNPSSAFLSLKASAAAPTSFAARRMSAATFLFSAASVSSLLADLRPDFPDATPFDALAALFWLVVTRASSVSSSSVTIVTDFRKRMFAPLPHGFYGNAAHFSRVQPINLAAGWASVANSIGRHVANLEEENYWSAIEWLAARREGGGGAFQMYGPELTFVKLDHAMAYGAKMEEGVEPVHVSCWVGGAEGEGVVMVLPADAAEGEARAVQMVLPAEVAEKVCNDEEILRHGPTVIFSGKI